MKRNQYTDLLLDQTKDLVWAIDHNMYLVYANNAYLNLMKEVTGVKKELNTPILVEGFGEGYMEKWRAYYHRALSGETFTIEEHFFHPVDNQTHFGHISFTPIKDEAGKVNCVACRNTDVTDIVREKYHASSLMDASLDVFCTIDEAGNFVYVSEAATKLWGYKPKELIGVAYASLIIEEDISKTNDVAAAVLSGAEINSFVNRYQKKDGSIAYNQWSARWDYDAKLMYCVARDAKEKIEQEILLFQSEQRFKNLVQEGADLIAIFDAEGTYRYVSPTSLSILGIEPDEFLGKSPFEFIHSEDVERFRISLEKIVKQQKAEIDAYRFKNRDGKWRWIETVLTNMLDNPAVKGLVANSRDITERIEEQHRLKLLESVITNTKDAVLITEAEPLDEPGPRIIYVNEAFTRMTGYTAEEVIGKTPRILQGPKSDKKELLRLSKALRNWEPCEITTVNYKKSGEEFWINFSVSPVADEKGWYTHWISIERDITEEKKLRELNRMSSKLAKIGSWEIDVVGNKLFWSEMVYELHETDPENFQPNLETAINLYRKDFRTLVTASVNKSIETGEPFDFEAVVVTLKKNERWVRAIGNAELIDGKCIRIYGSFQDIHERKEAELRLQSLANNLPGVVFQYLVYPDGKDELKYVTKGASDVWEYTPDEVMENIDLVWNQTKAGGNYDDVKRDIQESIRTKSKWISRYKSASPSGKIRTLLGTGTPDFLADGTVLFNSVVLDITQEAKNEELLNEVSKIAKIGSWETDLLHGKHYKSEMVDEILGLKPNQAIPDMESAIQFLRADFRQLLQSNFIDLIQNGKSFDCEAVIMAATKYEKWVRIIASPKMLHGNCIKIYGSIQDIHERKIVEHQKNSLLTTLEKSLNEIYVFDAETLKFSYVNQGALSNIGYSEHEINALTPLDLKPEFTAVTFNDLVTPLITTEKDRILFFTNHKRKNGSLYPVEVHLQLIKEGDNKRFLAVILDITERKKSEAAQIMAEKNYQELFDKSNDAIYVHDIDTGQLIDVNYRATELTGFDKMDFLEKEPSILFTDNPEYSMEKAIDNIQKAAKGEPQVFEWLAKKKDGTSGWFEMTLKRTSIAGVDKVLAFQRDISERKKAEEKLFIAYEEKNNILESIGDAFFTLDKDWTVTYWNKQAVKLLGLTKEEIVGKNFWDVFDDAIDSDFYRQYHHAMETGETVRFEEKYVTQAKWFEVNVYPSETGLSIYFTDVTLRKEADERLIKANERFEKATEATNDVIWDWDIESGTFFRSNAIDNFFGVGTSKVLEKKDFWNDNFHKADISKIKSSMNKALEDPYCNRWEEEYRILHNNNDIIFVIDRGLILRNKNGKPIRMVGAMTNITEQKKQEEKLIELNQSLNHQAIELKRSNEELEQFAFITSHDLQEPLRMISSFMDKLKQKYADRLDEKGLQYIYFATDGAKRMKRIILDLLLYSRANKPSEQIEELNLNEIIFEYTQLRRKLIDEKNAVITFEGLPILQTYRAPITQIFHCLLDNALKYVKDNVPPHIEILAKEKETLWEFAVKDNGIGIDEQFYDKIFIIFQRLHNRSLHDGTGIGLSIAKRSVEFLGGEIWLESKVDVGTTFYFTIQKK